MRNSSVCFNRVSHYPCTTDKGVRGGGEDQGAHEGEFSITVLQGWGRLVGGCISML